MHYVRNWVHLVWATKNKICFLSPGKKYEIISHIRTNAGTKGIYIDFLNGHSEHLHCLLLLRPDQTLSKVVQVIRNESSQWINRSKLIRNRFEWEEEYYGVSVGDEDLPVVRDYIMNQEAHHLSVSWEEEYTELMQKCGLVKCRV